MKKIITIIIMICSFSFLYADIKIWEYPENPVGVFSSPILTEKWSDDLSTAYFCIGDRVYTSIILKNQFVLVNAPLYLQGVHLSCDDFRSALDSAQKIYNGKKNASK